MMSIWRDITRFHWNPTKARKLVNYCSKTIKFSLQGMLFLSIKSQLKFSIQFSLNSMKISSWIVKNHSNCGNFQGLVYAISISARMVVLASSVSMSSTTAMMGSTFLCSQQPQKPFFILPKSRNTTHSLSLSSLSIGGIPPSSLRTPAVAAAADTTQSSPSSTQVSFPVHNFVF